MMVKLISAYDSPTDNFYSGTRVLNSRLHICKAGALSLEPHLHFALIILEKGSCELIAGIGLELQSS
jgi:hypothetical protein